MVYTREATRGGQVQARQEEDPGAQEGGEGGGGRRGLAGTGTRRQERRPPQTPTRCTTFFCEGRRKQRWGDKEAEGQRGEKSALQGGGATDLAREADDLALLHDEERALERVLRVALARDEFLDERGVARRPADRQPPADLALDALDLLVELAPRQALDRAGRDGVHRRELEQPDRLVDVVRQDDGRERDLGDRLGDADDGLELAGGEEGEGASATVARRRGKRVPRTYRTVMGIELRSSLSRSTCWTCLRSATKCDDSISDASDDRRGAQRLRAEGREEQGQRRRGSSRAQSRKGSRRTSCRRRRSASSCRRRSRRWPRFRSGGSCGCS